MTTTKPLSKKTFQTIAGITILLFFCFAMVDIMTLKVLYGNILPESGSGIAIELTSLFVLWIVVVIFLRTKTNMTSMQDDLRTMREGGVSGLLDTARAQATKQSTRWFYNTLAMFILASSCGFISYRMMAEHGSFPLKITILALVGSVGFVVCLVVTLVKKISGK